MVLRRAEFAGKFYPAFKGELIRGIEDCFLSKDFGPGVKLEIKKQDQRTVIGGVSPHAGYIYSGPCAAYTYLNLFRERIPDTVIILGNHHHPYSKIGIMKEGEWVTPLGNLKIDEDLAKLILAESNIVVEDKAGFLNFREHNIEVQLPFIKYCAREKEIEILPIKIARTTSHSKLNEFSSQIAGIINKYDKDIIIVASSDMSHYNVFDEEQLKTLKEIDQLVIDQFLKLNSEYVLNPESFINKTLFNKFSIGEREPSVCGRQTIAALILICKKLNFSKPNVLKYYNSKEISPGGHPWTVGYFSGILVK